MKRSVILTVAAVAAVCSAGAATQVVEQSGVYYRVDDSTGQAAVVKPTDAQPEGYQYPLGDDGELVIPSTVVYDGITYSVTAMEADAVTSQTAMKRLILPESMVEVCDAIYNCPELEYLDLGGATYVSTPRYDLGLNKVAELHFTDSKAVKIGEYSFETMEGLKILYLPAQYIPHERMYGPCDMFQSFMTAPLLEKIYSPAVTPPLFIYTDLYLDCECPESGGGELGWNGTKSPTYTAYIPVGCKDAYAENISWHNIVMRDRAVEMEFAGIETPIEDLKDDLTVGDGKVMSLSGRNIEVYTLSGSRVASDNLSAGIYIIRQDNGQMKKIVVK